MYRAVTTTVPVASTTMLAVSTTMLTHTMMHVTLSKQEKSRIMECAKNEMQIYMFTVDAVLTKDTHIKQVKQAISTATQSVIREGR